MHVWKLGKGFKWQEDAMNGKEGVECARGCDLWEEGELSCKRIRCMERQRVDWQEDEVNGKERVECAKGCDLLEEGELSCKRIRCTEKRRVEWQEDEIYGNKES
jgi:hypothetical protein